MSSSFIYKILSQQMSVLLKLFKEPNWLHLQLNRKEITLFFDSAAKIIFIARKPSNRRRTCLVCTQELDEQTLMQERREQAAQLQHERQSPVACSRFLSFSKEGKPIIQGLI